MDTGPLLVVSKPLPRVLLIHTGGTLGMDPAASFEPDEDGHMVLKEGTGGTFSGGLRPGDALCQSTHTLASRATCKCAPKPAWFV